MVWLGICLRKSKSLQLWKHRGIQRWKHFYNTYLYNFVIILQALKKNYLCSEIVSSLHQITDIRTTKIYIRQVGERMLTNTLSKTTKFLAFGSLWTGMERYGANFFSAVGKLILSQLSQHMAPQTNLSSSSDAQKSCSPMLNTSSCLVSLPPAGTSLLFLQWKFWVTQS